MKVAYTTAHTTMINRYTEAIGKMLHPGITLTFTLIAILGMIFGLFSINPIVTAIFVVLSILALIGMSTKKFKTDSTIHTNQSRNVIRNEYCSLSRRNGCLWD